MFFQVDQTVGITSIWSITREPISELRIFHFQNDSRKLTFFNNITVQHDEENIKYTNRSVQ